MVAASLLMPFVLRQNAWIEWANALWLVERQSESMRDIGHPTYFLHTEQTGMFYPQFLFYGGSLFAFAGGLSILFNSSWVALVVVLALASASAFGGTLWLGRQVGLGWGAASLPALAVATSPYAVSNLYGRGAFAEVVAVAALPLALAGLLSILRADRPWLGLSALAGAVAAVAGSHNITVVWGSLVGAALVAILAWAVGREGCRALRPRRAVAAVGGLLLGVALVAWSLIPAAAYGSATRAYADTTNFIDALPQIDRLDVILRPFPYADPSIAEVEPTNYYQLPVWVLAWAALALGFALWRREARRVDVRLAAGLWALLILLGVLLVANGLWDYLPGILTAIQFPLRLHAYAVIVSALLVIVALRTLRSTRYREIWLASLGVALIVQTAFAQYGAWNAPAFYPSYHDEVSSQVLPGSFTEYQQQMYLLEEGALARPPAPAITPAAADLSSDRLVIDGIRTVPRGYRTNIVASDVVRVRPPWNVVGHDSTGFVVLNAPRGGDARLVAEPARPWPVALGTVLSIGALGVAIVGGGFLLGCRFGRSVSGRARRA